MAIKNGSKLPTKFYGEDIVRRTGSSHQTGVVLRCWHDADDVSQPGDQHDPLMRPLERGEVGVSFLPSGTREILPESELELVDRVFQPGDLCKRSIDDVRSGVVTCVDVQGRLEHAISGQPVAGWKTTADIYSTLECELGDYVAYDDWIGQLFDEIVVETANGLVRLPELSSRLTIGERGNDIIPSPMNLPSFFGFLNRMQSNHEDVVVGIKHTVVAISWLAINQALPQDQAQTAVRPERFWSGANLSKLRLVRSRAEQMMHVGDKVLLKNWAEEPSTRHGKPADPGGDVEVRAYVVKETKTLVTVLWQDGKGEDIDSKELIPYLNPDEYDCWPGEHVLWKTEDEKRAAVVQSVDALERTARILFPETGAVELAPLLELDPHGSSDWSATVPATFDGLGVRRGDFVFIHLEGTTNGLEFPRVPRIGEVEPWVREPPVIHDDGHYGGWRQVMYELGMSIARRREHDDSHEGAVRRVRKDDTTFNWFGEVSDLHLDGNVEVTLPNGTVKVYPLARLTRLYDTLEQLEDILDDGMSVQDEDGIEEIMDEDGNWHMHHPGSDGEDWEDEDGDDPMDVDGDWPEEKAPSTPPDVKPPDGWWEEDTPETTAASPSPDSTVSSRPPTAAYSSSPDTSKEAPSALGNGDTDHVIDEDADSPWKRFEVLPEAPPDHAFHGTPINQPSRQFLARLQKEYRALTSSLPDTILVRAYEDRSDLLRSLIVGPENTPYEDAPFVIDWMLPSDFPQTPPVAHFLSWTNGNGRASGTVNPNLYEEGKVCLSILGTWAGDKNESWSPARSSILQALVSIQGLVLVKEPWFCEPAFDKLRGTEDGTVNSCGPFLTASMPSRLYNEKAYVLSRGFVRRALEVPLGSLAAEVTWLYHKQGKLAKVVTDARALVQKSREEPVDSTTVVNSDRAVPRLTGGAIITLERTLTKLESLQRSEA
ncbi:hypothetical protein K488DRAFT_67467 [Vararia minispora EC-137]|uniref:Uncharacterized protein n=1 Tax=Vararia minispora EC-137 TaxID=1314806 RepID=A0ACB8QXJ5_9AGAM|nr:hypothetical protein K488DRAFT_67467 [Vararia minispora EC-137]